MKMSKKVTDKIAVRFLEPYKDAGFLIMSWGSGGNRMFFESSFHVPLGLPVRERRMKMINAIAEALSGLPKDHGELSLPPNDLPLRESSLGALL